MITRLDSTIAVSWRAGEAGHPRLKADGGSVEWTGRISVKRSGTYRFAVILRGLFRLTVADREVLKCDQRGPLPARVEGNELHLDAGVHQLDAAFHRPPGLARISLVWKGPGFREEPLPYDVLGHIPEQVPDLERDTLIEQGRYLTEEHSCNRCHHPEDNDRLAAGLATRSGPELSQIGQRTHAGWLERWLESPRTMRPSSVMPELFTPDLAGRVERRAVAAFLASLGGAVKSEPIAPPPDARSASVRRGQILFQSIGCAVCHGEELNGLGNKTTSELLAQYLLDPLRLDPGGRMPNMLLNRSEASDLACFLCSSKEKAIFLWLSPAPATEHLLAALDRLEKRTDERALFRKLPVQMQWLDLGKRLVIDKGCNNCHTIAPDGKPFAAMQSSSDWNDLLKPSTHKNGCLADRSIDRGVAPWFGFDARQRLAVRAFLREGAKGAGSPAPAYSARKDLQRFHCLACHKRDGEGGLSAQQVKQLVAHEKPEYVEMIGPPTLSGIGHKLQLPGFTAVLTDAARPRPWMRLRMPQFGKDAVGKLAGGLTALDGADFEESPPRLAATPDLIEAGRQLVGKNVFGCIACHDLARNPSAGMRGPDLATSPQRLRYNWYRRWLEQPDRMVPGTKMPAVFRDGKSLADRILHGNCEAQAMAIWVYLSRAGSMPLPIGMQSRQKRPRRRSRKRLSAQGTAYSPFLVLLPDG